MGNLENPLATDFHGFIMQSGVSSGMIRKTRPHRPSKQSLADGQVWRMSEAILHVTKVGKLLAQYKLGKPNATRISGSIDSIATVEKYLKTHKAVLV